MNIVLTGSLGNISKPLTQLLVANGHLVTVISSKAERISDIEALGAVAAIGTIQDVNFLTETFKGADAVYLMEAWEGIGSLFDQNIDFVAEFEKIADNYVEAVQQSGVRQIIHLSSIGAHSDQGTSSLLVHHKVENILKKLPENVSVKFIRPVGFFSNVYRWLPMIKSQGAIIQSYGGDQKEPWVSPYDIAQTVADEMDQPFVGRTVHYVASDEVSPNQIAELLGEAIGNNDLKWTVYPNPSSGILNINTANFSETVSLSIADLNGRIVYTDENFDTQKTVDIHKLESGMYLVKIVSDGTIYTQKIIKN